ncbi:unnamed protein product [Coregonus sp. 'balchen']|nr:unnamed protein product [Coregonus sp. 'balchen']
MALVVRLSTLMFVLTTGTETSKSLSQGPELKLKQVIQVESGEDAVLQCSVKFGEKSPGNVEIEWVVLWKLDHNGDHEDKPVFQSNIINKQSSDTRMPPSPKYQLFANEKDQVVSLLVKETKPEDVGQYECVVNTNSGNTKCTIMLNVTETALENPENPGTQKDIPKNSYMGVAAVFVVVGSLAIGLLLLKLFQAIRLRQHEPLTQEDSVVAEEPEDTAVPAEHDLSTMTGLFL